MHKDPDGKQYMDFDAMVAPPIRFRVGGKRYEVPSDLPTSITLQVARDADKAETKEQEAFGIRMLRQALGDAEYDEIVASTGISQFKAIMEYLQQQWGFETEKEDGGGKPQETASPSPSRISSINGDSSSQTLDGTGEPDLATSSQEVG